MQPAPDAGPRPDQEPAVRGRLRYPETRGQSPPGATADQHVDDRREQRLIRCVLRSAALWPYLRRWDQRLRISHSPSGTIHLQVPRPIDSPTSDHHIGHRLRGRSRSAGVTWRRQPGAGSVRATNCIPYRALRGAAQARTTDSHTCASKSSGCSASASAILPTGGPANRQSHLTVCVHLNVKSSVSSKLALPNDQQWSG